MKRLVFFFGITLSFFCAGKATAQTVDPAAIEALKRKAEALKHLDQNAIRRDPQAALREVNKYLKTVDSVTNNIKDKAASQAPNAALVKKYMHLPKNADTAYTTVELKGTMDITFPEGGSHTRVACKAKLAPLVRNGSNFSVMLITSPVYDKQAALIKNNKVMGSNAVYLTNQNAITGSAGFMHAEHRSQNVNGHILSEDIKKTSTEIANPTQEFLFAFDTLSNIGQASYIRSVHMMLIRGYDSLVSVGDNQMAERFTQKTELEVPAGVAAITNSSTWDLNALNRDSAYNVLNQISGGQMLNGRPDDDGKPKPVLIVTKMPYGFMFSCNFSNRDGQTVTNIHLHGFIGRPPSDYEAIIYPVVPLGDRNNNTYEHWLPKGPKVDNSDDTKGNDELQFSIVVRSKKDPTKIFHNYTTNWELDEVTNYPGFCNNYPKQTSQPNTDPDLVFHKDMRSDDNFDTTTISDNTASTKTGKGEFGHVKINCMDYAAWGKLTATLIMEDGYVLDEVEPYYDNNKDHLTIPFDKDENRLADWWESENGILNAHHPLTWDEDDKPNQQRDNGDGYTLFEEYRGFAMYYPSRNDTKFDFERTDPKKKDAFVYDKDELFKENYETANPSDLSWHYLTLDDDHQQFLYYANEITTPLSRWVNFNKADEYFYSEQYCLVLESSAKEYMYDAKMTGCSFTAGEWQYAQMNLAGQDPNDDQAAAIRISADPMRSRKSPMKNFLKIEIFPARIRAKAVAAHLSGVALQSTVSNLLKGTVRHEVGHCIGMLHHSAPAGASEENTHDEKSEAEVDGVIGCIMRYQTEGQRIDPAELLTEKVRYCRKDESGPYYYRVWDMNEDGTRKKTFTEHVAFTVKPSDDCYGQISVKSKPGE